MSDQPEALRLADRLEGRWALHPEMQQAAAELRRLYAENERLRQINQSHEMKLSVRGYEIQIADLEAQRDALKAERDALKAAAEKGTEYVLAQINQDLRTERDALLGILKDALSDAEWSEKIIYPFVGEDFQSWRLTVFLGVPLSESDKSPEAALERTISAAIDAARGKT